MHHYTYLLVNTQDLKLYIGKRSCNCFPVDDTAYMGSSKYVPKHLCTKIILQEFSTSDQAIEHEMYLHNKYNVGINPLFYNKAKQTSLKFDTTGVPMPCSDETKQKLSKVKKGIVPNWSDAGKHQILSNLNKGRSAEVRIKSGQQLKTNGSNKGTKNSQFRPWFISTETVTYLFLDISKSELSVLENHYNKFYADLQKKFNRDGVVITKKYGKILNMGFLPKQYKI